MSDLGKLKYILGIEVEYYNNDIKIYQRKYIEDLVEKFKQIDANTYNTPMEAGVHLKKQQEGELITNHPYQSLIGSLLYLSNCTRPDITFAVNKLSSYNANPTELHWKCAKRILNYLKKTKDYGTRFTKSTYFEINGYSDADWANDLDTRRSTTGYLISINLNPVSWNSKRQSTVATSTAEAEYMAIYETIREVLWIKKLLNDLKIDEFKINVLCDNQSAIHLSKNPIMHQRTKHIDIKYHYIRECIQQHDIIIKHIESQMMTADIFTKPLAFPIFSKLCGKVLNDIGLRGSIGNNNPISEN